MTSSPFTDRKTIGGDEHPGVGVVDDGAVECDPPRVDRQQPGNGGDCGRLARPLGHGLSGFDRQVDIEQESIGPSKDDACGEAGNGQSALHQRLRRAVRTTKDTTTMRRLMATAASRSLSRATNTASGSVWVLPWRFPAKVMVAPNSPKARAQVSTSPDRSDGPNHGQRHPAENGQRDAQRRFHLGEDVGQPVTTEKGEGPRRVIHHITATGHRRLRRWLSEPVEHLRDLRIEFLLKLALIKRSGDSPIEVIRNQKVALEPTLNALDHSGADPGDHVELWRRHNAAAAAAYIAELEAIYT